MNCDGVSNLLSAYVDGELSPGELLRVEEHLRRCHACADEVDSLRQTIALVSSLEEVELPASFGFQLHQRLVALGPPVAAVRRTPAAPSWQRNVRRWAVPAAAAAAALAIGLTTFDQVADQLPGGLRSESKYEVAPAVKSATPEKSQAPNGTDVGTNATGKPQQTNAVQPPTREQVTTPPVPPIIGGGKTTTDGVGGRTSDTLVTVQPEKTAPKYMVYAANVTVTAPLDPAVEAKIKDDITTVEKGNNTLTIIVPPDAYQRWLDKVVKEYFPGSTSADASQSRDAEIDVAQERYDAALRQREQDAKVDRADKDQILANDDKVIADAKTALDLLTQQTKRATITVKFAAP